jgi:hypothetical protein
MLLCPRKKKKLKSLQEIISKSKNREADLNLYKKLLFNKLIIYLFCVLTLWFLEEGVLVIQSSSMR